METSSIIIATATGAEEATLCSIEGVTYALVVPIAGNGREKWYLQASFGCGGQEGRIFGTLDDVTEWIEDRIRSRHKP